MKKYLNLQRNVDFSELCITSNAKLKKLNQMKFWLRQQKPKVKNVQFVGKLAKNHVKDIQFNK